MNILQKAILITLADAIRSVIRDTMENDMDMLLVVDTILGDPVKGIMDTLNSTTPDDEVLSPVERSMLDKLNLSMGRNELLEYVKHELLVEHGQVFLEFMARLNRAHEERIRTARAQPYWKEGIRKIVAFCNDAITEDELELFIESRPYTAISEAKADFMSRLAQGAVTKERIAALNRVGLGDLLSSFTDEFIDVTMINAFNIGAEVPKKAGAVKH